MAQDFLCGTSDDGSRLCECSCYSTSTGIAGVDPFNGWDIQVESNQSVISPISLSITGDARAPERAL